MPRTKSTLVKLHRFSSFLLILLFCTLLVSTLSVAEGSQAYVEMTDRHILQGDTLVLNIWPVVERLSVDTFSFTPELDFQVSFFLNYSGISVVRMIPLSEGTYNLTVMFETEKAWNYTVGVFTNRPSFYGEYARVLYDESGGFVSFYTRTMEGSSGNSTLILTLNSHGDNLGAAPWDSTFWLFNLPAPLDFVVFVAVTVVLGYADAFFVADSYFKSKKDGSSWKRWALIVLLLAASLWVIYQAYLFAAM